MDFLIEILSEIEICAEKWLRIKGLLCVALIYVVFRTNRSGQRTWQMGGFT